MCCLSAQVASRFMPFTVLVKGIPPFISFRRATLPAAKVMLKPKAAAVNTKKSNCLHVARASPRQTSMQPAIWKLLTILIVCRMRYLSLNWRRHFYYLRMRMVVQPSIFRLTYKAIQPWFLAVPVQLGWPTPPAPARLMMSIIKPRIYHFIFLIANIVVRSFDLKTGKTAPSILFFRGAITKM